MVDIDTWMANGVLGREGLEIQNVSGQVTCQLANRGMVKRQRTGEGAVQALLQLVT